MSALDRIIDLNVGQPNFPTPPHIREAACKAIAENPLRSAPPPGFLDLREAVCRKLREENGIDCTPEEIVITCGGRHALYNALQCTIQPGDEVLLFSPYWSAYPEQVRLTGGKPVMVPTTEANAYQPDIGAVRAALTPQTRALIVNSPCNPTGAVFGRDILQKLGELAVEQNLLLLSDEVYEKVIFDGLRHLSIGSLGPEIARRTITINSLSTTHSMTGWRIGYARMPVELAKRVMFLQSLSTSGACAVAQRAAFAALTGDQAHVKQMADAYATRRELMMKRLSKIPPLDAFEPRGTFYLFINISSLVGQKIGGVPVANGDSLAEIFRTQAKVHILSGTYSGSLRHIRLSFAASPAELGEGMNRIERLLQA